MRRLARCFALAALLGACARPRPASPAGFTPADEAAVRALLVAQQAAWNRGDLDGYMAGYLRSPALVFTSGGVVRHGWDETHARYVARYGRAQGTMGHLSFEILGIQAVGADGAVVLGRWRLDGAAVGAGIFSVVVERRPEGWRVIHDHTSSDPAPPHS